MTLFIRATTLQRHQISLSDKIFQMASQNTKKQKRHRGLSSIDLMRQVIKLRNKGHSWDEIGSSAGLPGLLPISKRQAQRLLKQAAEQGVTLDEFNPWTVSYSLENGDDPEKARWLLEAGQQLIGEDGLDKITAKWLWFIHQIKAELTWDQLEVLATRYVDAEFDRNLKWTSQVLDKALTISPWVSLFEAERFFRQAYEYAPTKADLLTVSDIDLELRWAWRKADDFSDQVEDRLSEINQHELTGIPVIRRLPTDVLKLLSRRTIADELEIGNWVTIPPWPEKERMIIPGGPGISDLINNTNPFLESDQ